MTIVLGATVQENENIVMVMAITWNIGKIIMAIGIIKEKIATNVAERVYVLIAKAVEKIHSGDKKYQLKKALRRVSEGF